MYEDKPGLDEIAFMDLKGQIVKLMFDFVDKYSDRNNPNNLHPRTGYIIVDVLQACLNEAKLQIKGNHE